MKYLPTVRLNGTSGWDPYGESILSIISRLAQKNHLDATGIGRIVGKRKHKTFLTERRLNPENVDVIDLCKLGDIGAWSGNSFTASFGREYVWPIVRPKLSPRMETNPRKISERGPLMKNIRLCHRCAVDDVHLIFHQLRGWSHCPVHEVTLSNVCPKCFKKFGPYTYSYRGIIPPTTACPHCNWNNNIAGQVSDSDVAIRRKFILEYMTWMDRVKDVLANQNRSVVFIGLPDYRFDMATVEQLIPGPDWLRGCLLESSELITSSTFNKKMGLNIRPKLPNRLFDKNLRETPDYRVGNTVAKATIHAIRCYGETDSYLKSMDSGLFHKVADRFECFVDEVDEYNDLITKPWFLWRAQFDRYFLVRRVSKFKPRIETIADSSLWSYWRNGPANVMQDEFDRENSDLCLWVNNIWWRKVFLESYYWMFRNYLSYCLDEEFYIKDDIEGYQSNLSTHGVLDPARRILGLLRNTNEGAALVFVNKKATQHAHLLELAATCLKIGPSEKAILQLFQLLQNDINRI